MIYLNQIGGQDELVFDGCSKVFDERGAITHRLAAFDEQTTIVEFDELNIIPMVDSCSGTFTFSTSLSSVSTCNA